MVGNGCHTASSTRTSLGVPALQGFSPSTLHIASALARQRATSTCVGRRISPVLPSHASAGPCRRRLRTSVWFLTGISRSQSMGVVLTVRRSCELCRLPLLPPELLALVQLPVPRWSSCPVICRVAVALPVAVRIALPRRCPLRFRSHADLAVFAPNDCCFSFPSHAVPRSAFRSSLDLRASGRLDVVLAQRASCCRAAGERLPLTQDELCAWSVDVASLSHSECYSCVSFCQVQADRDKRSIWVSSDHRSATP